jgi:putative copper export protein
MPETDHHAVAQAVHDLGSALWFGGATMGVVGVNRSGRDLPQGIDRIRVAKSGWSRFSPLEWAGIGATMLAGLQLTRSSAGRLVAQKAFGPVGAIKAGVTVLGALATAYAGYCGRRIASLAEQANQRGEQVEVEDATTPTPRTSDNIAGWQRRQQVVQYVVPVLAGTNIALGSYLTESYRPGPTARGMARRLFPGS